MFDVETRYLSELYYVIIKYLVYNYCQFFVGTSTFCTPPFRHH